MPDSRQTGVTVFLDDGIYRIWFNIGTQTFVLRDTFIGHQPDARRNAESVGADLRAALKGLEGQHADTK